ncbi:unnamed protein product [Thelazia callipaeda]|uniref:GPI transamidase component PIG-S n=1 Tax=Thelazia callipaeda TaxID=103827 RepID=A0A0N5CYR6_THECL|nr:unnamed protein product [Thelazia callipaeda]
MGKVKEVCDKGIVRFDCDESLLEAKEERAERVLALTPREREELPYRRISALSFIAIMLIFGVPLWWQTTSTYRAPFHTFSVDDRILVPIHISVASSHSSLKFHVDRSMVLLLNNLYKLPEIDHIHFVYKWNHKNVDYLEITPRTKGDKLDIFGMHVAIVNETAWPYSGYTIYFGNLWTFVLNSEDETELAQRMFAAITNFLLDINHLSAIVRRDLRRRIQTQDIDALSPSQQKRLIWDSVALNAQYIVHVIFLHAGYKESNGHHWAERVVLNARRFAMKLAEVTELIISSEHLWDFDLNAWLMKDIKGRNIIHMSDISKIVTAVEQETSTVESSAPVIKLVLFDSLHPITLLDQYEEDCNSVVVASWGALFSTRDSGSLIVDESVIAAMRVLFGLDTDLPNTAQRLPLPVAEWEIRRMKLRSFIDCSINAISSVGAIKKLVSQISSIVISDEVANKTNYAVKLISETLSAAEKTGNIEVASVIEGRALAESALNDQSLLSLLYFPNDQKFAIYLPLFLPTLLSLLGSVLTLNRYWMGKE